MSSEKSINKHRRGDHKVLFFGNADDQEQLKKLVNNDSRAISLISALGEKAIDIAAETNPHVVIVDLDKSRLKPLEFIEQILGMQNETPVVGITEKAPLNTIVTAVRMGVHEVVNLNEEPFRLSSVISRLVGRSGEFDKGEALFQKQRRKFEFNAILGRSTEMQRLFHLLSKITQRKWVTVLIQGETGTGKGLVAQTIHYNSFDRFHPFVEISCNALPENLLESELFGYEKGAFTDAKRRKKGLLELAQNGTLFLDEIGEISISVQTKLLQALEQKKIRRLGGTRDIVINTRLISATNRNLKEAIEQGLFRTDLYYRLNVISLNIPPLRERGDDILLLAKHFLAYYLNEYKSTTLKFSQAAERLLRDYHWPGNVRELRHTIERLVLLADDKVISKESLREIIDSEMPLIQKKIGQEINADRSEQIMSLAEHEKIIIQRLLDRFGWNKTRVSEVLEISRTRLDRKIKKYDLSPEKRK